jgi:hypothetical protein
MTQIKLGPFKLVIRLCEFVFWQLLYFIIAVYVLSFIDDILSALLDYDDWRNHTSIAVTKYCLIFLFFVAIPRTVIGIFNKPRQFIVVNLTSTFLMGFYLCYDYFDSLYLAHASGVREFIVLFLSLLITIGITIPLLKELPRHVLKQAD